MKLNIRKAFKKRISLKQLSLILLVAVACGAGVTAAQISLDSPASLPSDI